MPEDGSRQEIAPLSASGVLGTLLAQGSFMKALGHAMRSVTAAPCDVNSLIRLANVETMLGFHGRAKRTWLRAIALEDKAATRLGLGVCLYAEGSIPEAVEQFEAGLSQAPDDLALLAAASVALTAQREFERARAYAMRAIAIEPTHPDALLCLARAGLELGKPAEAEAVLSSLDKDVARADEVALLRAGVMAGYGQSTEALFELSDLCETFPASEMALTQFRDAFQRLKTHDPQALDDLLGTLAVSPPAEDIRPVDRVVTCTEGSVDVIIPVHNGYDLAERTIRSVFENSGRLLRQVIVVDDASRRHCATGLKKIAAEFPSVSVVTLEARKGFTQAVAAGVAQSRASSFVALNSDTIVSRGWLDRMHDCLRQDGNLAMVGPLSNNAAWQTYRPVFSENGMSLSYAVPSGDMQHDALTRIEAIGAGRYVETGLVHGFCALVDRRIYDAIGGLDTDLFPEGYGEFQDLSLRFRAAGYGLGVALDAVVFHERGASLAPALRASLSLEGRKKLYGRYSAFNYLCIENACFAHDGLQSLRRQMGGPAGRSFADHAANSSNSR